jgi:prepilin-type N-terminal cleavage/methylation domain-containing protein
MKSTRTRGLGGFTLVEIMVVVAIIALLAAITIPNLLRAGAKSQANACINNLRQIDTAMQEFALEQGKTTGASINYPADLTPYIRLNTAGNIPPCPVGGVYTVNVVGYFPSAFCSLGTTITPAHMFQ